ncbi:MAG: two-component regulator propeller domain-containing protein [Spirosomataceae bacterium]
MRFWLFFLLPICVFAQTKQWQDITIADGLSQGMIFDLIQDRQGFLWIGTKDGLNRYDGYHFKVFTNDTYTPHSISGNTVTALFEDHHGRLWVGTEKGGLNLFDARTQRFYHCRITDDSGIHKGNYDIIFIREDPDGNIWISTYENKLFKITLPASLKKGFPPKTDFTESVEIKALPLPHVPNEQNFFGNLCFSKEGPLLLASRLSLYSIDWKKVKVIRRLQLGNPLTGTLNSLIQDSQNRLWMVDFQDIICVKNGAVIHRIPLSGKAFLRLNNTGHIIVAGVSSLWKFTPDKLLSLSALTSENAWLTDATHSLFTVTTKCIEDNRGNIWFATRGYGLRKFNPRVLMFHHYLPGYSTNQLFEDQKGNIFVRDANAYELLNKAGNSITPLKATYPELADTRNNILFMFQDKNLSYWLLQKQSILHPTILVRLSADQQLIKKYPLPASYKEATYGNQVLEDSSGVFWIGAGGGKMLKFDPVRETFDVLSYESLLPKGGGAIETFALYKDHAGVIWIGTQEGMIRMSHPLTKPTFSHYTNSATDRESLSNNFVSGMLDDPYQPERYLWVSTKGGGLDRLDRQTGKFRHFTEADGLPNKVVYGLLADENRHLWMSTNRGLAKLDLKTFQFQNFTKADGLQDDEFNTKAYGKTRSGELMFGGVNGINIFRASEIVGYSEAAPIRLFGLKVNNKTIEAGDASGLLSEDIAYTKTVEVAHDQNQITFEFGVMNLSNPQKNRFRYQLEGVEDNWVEAGTLPSANYSQLPSGSYTFRVMGTADGTSWSRPIELKLHVHPPFYRTWWSYLFYLAVVSYLGYRWYQSQLNRVRLQQQLLYKDKETERLAELDQIKTNFFTNISHEFRTPLTLILSPLEELQKETPARPVFQLMYRNAQQLLSLINQLLDLSKLEAGQMKPEVQRTELVRFFRTLAGSFSSLAETRKIPFELIQNRSSFIGLLDKDKTEKIVSNLLSNAFKFTESGKKVTLSIHYADDNRHFVIKVRDEGIGVAQENAAKIFDRFYQIDTTQHRKYEGTGIGLALVKELAEVLKGRIQVSSQEGIGTVFEVELPIDPDDQNDLPPEDTPFFAPFMVSAIQEPVSDAAQLLENILLVVDDNADIRAYIRSIFEKDYHVIEAVHGKEGIEKAIAFIPDIVISDLMMPEMDGFEFCEQLKSNEKTSHIPIVMLTAKATLEDRIEGFELGADEYLTKPFSTAEIKARVKNLIKIRDRLRALFRQNPPDIPSSPIRVHSKDAVFIQKAKAIVDRHIAESQFDITQFAREMNMAPLQLRRKLKALTNQTAIEFVRHSRLQRARELLRQKAGTVSEVAFQVGFESLSYFTKVFQETFGHSPSDLIK